MFGEIFIYKIVFGCSFVFDLLKSVVWFFFYVNYIILVEDVLFLFVESFSVVFKKRGELKDEKCREYIVSGIGLDFLKLLE